MKPTPRQLLKIAGLMRKRLVAMRLHRHVDLQREIDNLLDEFDELRSIHKLLGVCKERGWLIAGDYLEERQRRVKSYLTSRIGYSEPDAKPKPVPTLRALLEDLRSVEQEFGSLHYDERRNRISIVTSAIVLEEVYLGPFEVRLHLDRLGESHFNLAFTVVAVDPHPAGSNSNVTHPHVSDERLCAGDAFNAIKQALIDGRICDFFVIVRSVLNTYNPDSPFVALSDWDGVSCYNCGYNMNPDYVYWCSYCDHDFCEECSSRCDDCEETICDHCGVECEICESYNCRRCIVKCECGREICRHCNENGKCPCKQESEERIDERDDCPADSGAGGTAAQTTEKAKPEAAVHAVCLGEAAVSARPQ